MMCDIGDAAFSRRSSAQQKPNKFELGLPRGFQGKRQMPLVDDRNCPPNGAIGGGGGVSDPAYVGAR